MAAAGQTYTVIYECSSGNEYDGRLGVRISSIFVIGFGSFCGTPAAFQKGVFLLLG